MLAWSDADPAPRRVLSDVCGASPPRTGVVLGRSSDSSRLVPPRTAGYDQAMAARKKRHHFLPRSYLARFAIGGNVLVRRRDGTTFLADTINVAVEAGMYDLPTPTGVVSHVEDLLAVVDDAALAAMRTVDATGQPPARGSQERDALAGYLALLMGRTPEARGRHDFPARVARHLAGRPLTRELVADYLEEVHLRFKPSDAEVEGAFTMVQVAMQDPSTLTKASSLDMMLGSVPEIYAVIDRMHWAVEHDRKGRLFTSDAPVVMWRTPSPRDAFEGVGLSNAEEVRFPLDPAKLLVLTHRRRPVDSRMSGERARSVNAETAAACYDFIVARPDRREAAQQVRMAAHRPAMRFNVGPGYEVEPDGKRRRMEGEILHFWIPRHDDLDAPRRSQPKRTRP